MISFLNPAPICLCGNTIELRTRISDGTSTPHPEMDFAGLIPGDRWCLCALRWQEALENHAAPKVHLEATHIDTLEHIKLENLKKYAVKEKEDSTGSLSGER